MQRERLLRSAISGPRARNSHAFVVDEIGHAIVEGAFPAGTILPGDAQLAERFSVSRTVLREAMKTLAAKGMLVSKARVGTRVTDRRNWNLFDADVLRWQFESGLDRAFLDHLRDMRLVLEPAAARMAATHASAEDVDRILAAADGMSPSGDNADFAMADLALHLAVLDASKNPFMQSVANLIEAALAIIFSLSTSEDREVREHTVTAHREIAEAIAAHDPDRADQAMRRVINEGRDRIAGRLAAG